MMKSAMVIALILCLPGDARANDRSKVSSDGRVRGLFCSRVHFERTISTLAPGLDTCSARLFAISVWPPTSM
jgi:hypothetical protein